MDVDVQKGIRFLGAQDCGSQPTKSGGQEAAAVEQDRGNRWSGVHEI
jgi:hypothetical protein